ncbi:uncharacterized protein PGTG_13105 [Puccinia graminis f. sp. tritici CRL 75-36-700-3]|uniref:Uncharacterized protein n=1 Tax=Puccinia graminis f. sp. tritici (strain CRL 75-36-700-3 / race SCCL) TaxID=418459 RepID=E3KQZ8_PUCGT|nr:uncharacterized protein PGTG_13105 [Puccinia graminis f. sp. tritici CRL 75-36-700-3]EFP86723.1 hypothetical protein PGTG_13105 [Puccinia graminis f. sp. tritici CRL 75-36-700-3]
MTEKDKVVNRSISFHSNFWPLEESVATIKPRQIYGSVLTPSFVTCNGDDAVDYRVQLITSDLLRPSSNSRLTDKTFTSGVGLVVGLMKQNSEEDPEFKAGKKLYLWIQVNHSDWDPIDRLVKRFDVKYILPANPKLVNTHIMIRVGREFTFNGYLSGWDLKEHTAIITVLGFSPINMGGSSPTSKTNAYSP